MSYQGGSQPGLHFLSGQLGSELLVGWPLSGRASPGGKLLGGHQQLPVRQDRASMAHPREWAMQAHMRVRGSLWSFVSLV